MEPARFYVAPEYATIVTLLDSLLSELNVGLLIYHLENAGDVHSLKLIYANREAARSTGLDMENRVGKPILEAFPGLDRTDIPRVYHEVVTTGKSRRIDVPYSDAGEMAVSYAVRAFPMPEDCVGVLFEREDAVR